MLNQQTLEKLRALRLLGMAEAFRNQAEQPDITQLSFEERSPSWSINSGIGRLRYAVQLSLRGVAQLLRIEAAHRRHHFTPRWAEKDAHRPEWPCHIYRAAHSAPHFLSGSFLLSEMLVRLTSRIHITPWLDLTVHTQSRLIPYKPTRCGDLPRQSGALLRRGDRGARPTTVAEVERPTQKQNKEQRRIRNDY